MFFIRFTPFNLITLTLIGVTVWLAISRFTGKLENNWPLFYYLALVLYLKSFEGGLSPEWVFGGVVCGLLLRFEFMAGFVLNTVRAAEVVVLSYVLWRSLSLIMMW